MENNVTVETNGQSTTVDYKAEYEKMVAQNKGLQAEVEKQKRMKDQYATENADYKKKAEAQMTEEEKRAKEWQEMLDSKSKMETELAQMKLEKDCLSNGFTAEESEKLIKGNFAVKDIAEIIKTRVEEAVKSAKAEMTKGSTTNGLLGKGTAEKGNEKSDFQKYQESKSKNNQIVKL